MIFITILLILLSIIITDTDARNAIQAAINDYTTMTCIRFRVRTAADADYVRFFRGNG